MRTRDAYLITADTYGKHNVRLEALALIQTEGKFRGAWFRVLELFAFLLLPLSQDRRKRMTIGFAQVQYRYWEEYICDSRLSVAIETMSFLRNYEVCLHYLDFLGAQTEREILIGYNGKPSQLYVKYYRSEMEKLKHYHGIYV